MSIDNEGKYYKHTNTAKQNPQQLKEGSQGDAFHLKS